MFWTQLWSTTLLLNLGNVGKGNDILLVQIDALQALLIYLMNVGKSILDIMYISWNTHPSRPQDKFVNVLLLTSKMAFLLVISNLRFYIP